MDSEFWHQRWQTNQIGFHEPEANPLLTEHFPTLNLANNSRILVPLCGKSHDLAWLAAQGHEVIGVELSTLAVEAFFEEQKLSATITDLGPVRCYKANNIEILVGDFFEVTADHVGVIDAIYDRAALVALPDESRIRYTQHLTSMAPNAKQLLITYAYDQTLMAGPPFSIVDAEVALHYQNSHEISLLDSETIEGKLKGQTATEKVWVLEPKVES